MKASDAIPRNPLDPIPSASWYNSSLSAPSAPAPSTSVHPNSRKVPRNNKENFCDNETSAIATRHPPPAPLSSIPTKKRRSRRRRLARHAAEREERHTSAAPLTQDARWANQRAAVPAGATQPLPETSDPTSARRTAVYPPSRIVGDSPTNENSPFQIGLESSRFPGLYKPAFQTSSRTYTLEPSERTAQDQASPLPLTWCPGLELYTHCSRVFDAQIRASRGRRPSKASRLPAPRPATYSSGFWKPCPFPEASYNQKTRFQEAFQKTPTQLLHCGIPASQTLTSTGALV